MVDNFFFSFASWNHISNKEVFMDKIGGIDPGAPKNPKIAKKISDYDYNYYYNFFSNILSC